MSDANMESPFYSPDIHKRAFKDVGWKIHLATHHDMDHPINQKITDLLVRHKFYDFKHGSNGSQVGKGTTIYTGDRDATEALARLLVSEIPEIPPAYGNLIQTELPVIPGDNRIYARFEENGDLDFLVDGNRAHFLHQHRRLSVAEIFMAEREFMTRIIPAEDSIPVMSGYGVLGLPIQKRPVAPFHTELSEALGDDWRILARGKTHTEIAELIRQEGNPQDEFKRSFRLLTAMYGDFFTGTDRTNRWWEKTAGVSFSDDELKLMHQHIPYDAKPFYVDPESVIRKQIEHNHRLKDKTFRDSIGYPRIRALAPDFLHSNVFPKTIIESPLGNSPEIGCVSKTYPEIDPSKPDYGTNDPVNKKTAINYIRFYHGLDGKLNIIDPDLLSEKKPAVVIMPKEGLSAEHIQNHLKQGRSLNDVSLAYATYDTDSHMTHKWSAPADTKQLKL